MMLLKDLIDKAQNWDLYYQMSDDPRIYDRGRAEEVQLIKAIQELSNKDKFVIQKLCFLLKRVNS